MQTPRPRACAGARAGGSIVAVALGVLACAQRPALAPRVSEAPAPSAAPPGPAPSAAPAEPAPGAAPPEPASGPVDEPAGPGPPSRLDVEFSHACVAGARATIGAVGDILPHVELQQQAMAAPDGFRVLWREVAELLASVDLLYGNLETPIARGVDRDGNDVPDPGRVYDKVVYSSYPRFNVHPSLASDLVKAGFGIVSTANNHALDRGPLGVDRTIEALRAAKLAFVGTRHRSDASPRWVTVVRAGPLRVAFIACTRHTNQRPDPEGQVMRCDKQRRELLALIRKTAARDDVDAVIVTPHWGSEYVHEPTAQQQTWAREWLEAGALAVIGNHPHVLQPIERVVTSSGREGVVAYSLGNFASHQPELPRRSSVLLIIELVRVPGAKAELASASWAPIHVRQQGREFFVEPADLAGESAEHVAQVLGAGNLIPPRPRAPLARRCE